MLQNIISITIHHKKKRNRQMVSPKCSNSAHPGNSIVFPLTASLLW